MRAIYLLGLSVLLVMTAACSSNHSKPVNLLGQVESKIEQAERMDVEDYAPLALRNAKKHLKDGKRSMEGGENHHAKHHLEKALVEVDYAIAKTSNERKQTAATQIKKSLDTLRTEIN